MWPSATDVGLGDETQLLAAALPRYFVEPLISLHSFPPFTEVRSLKKVVEKLHES